MSSRYVFNKYSTKKVSKINKTTYHTDTSTDNDEFYRLPTYADTCAIYTAPSYREVSGRFSLDNPSCIIAKASANGSGEEFVRGPTYAALVVGGSLNGDSLFTEIYYVPPDSHFLLEGFNRYSNFPGKNKVWILTTGYVGQYSIDRLTLSETTAKDSLLGKRSGPSQGPYGPGRISGGTSQKTSWGGIAA